MQRRLTEWLKKRLLWLLTNYPNYFFKLGIKSIFIWNEPELDYNFCRENKLPFEKFVAPDFLSIGKIEQWLSEPNKTIIWYPDLPEKVKNIAHPPLLLFCEGNIKLLNTVQLAMVGTRHPSLMGLAIAEKFAEIFTSHDLTITSGLAAGIDAASHEGALKKGLTIAIMGTGMLATYPVSNKKLRARILANQGLILSELPLEAPPQYWHFPLRNRLISALSQGVLVIEAGLKSGSLITARLACEQGKEVFAVPGSIYHKQSQGTLFLITQGAKLVTKPEDVLETFLPSLPIEKPVSPTFTSVTHAVIWEILDEPLSFETLVQRSGLTNVQVQFALLELLNQQKIIQREQSYFRNLKKMY